MAFSAWPMLERTPTDRNSSSPLPLLRTYPLYLILANLTFLPSHLNGKHVVFGEVLEGYNIVEKIQDVPKDSGDRPKQGVKIVKSGEIPVEADPEDKGSDEL